MDLSSVTALERLLVVNQDSLYLLYMTSCGKSDDVLVTCHPPMSVVPSNPDGVEDYQDVVMVYSFSWIDHWPVLRDLLQQQRSACLILNLVKSEMGNAWLISLGSLMMVPISSLLITSSSVGQILPDG